MAKRIKGSNVQAVITDGKVTGLAVNGQDIGVVTLNTSTNGVPKLNADNMEIDAQQWSVVSSRPLQPKGSRADVAAQTSRILHVLPHDVSAMKLVYASYYNRSTGNGESPFPNPVMIRAGIFPETVIGDEVLPQVGYQALFSGKQIAVLGRGLILESDPIEVALPAGTPFYIKTWQSAELPDAPIAPTVTPAITGGQLVAATYKVALTIVYTDSGLESQASAGTSAAVASGSTGTITVTAPTAVPGAVGYRVWMTLSGGAEPYYDVGCGVVPFGRNAVIVASSVIGVNFDTAETVVPSTPKLLMNSKGNLTGGGQQGGRGTGEGAITGIDAVSQSCGAVITAFAASTGAFGPVAILGLTKGLRASAAVVGDSIGDGSHDAGHGGVSGFIPRGIQQQFGRKYDPTIIPPAGMTVVTQGSETPGRAADRRSNLRSQIAALARSVVSDHAINSMSSGSPLTATDIVGIADRYLKQGKRYFHTTCTPSHKSTDGYMTLGGHTQQYARVEAARRQINSWVRSTLGESPVSAERPFRGTLSTVGVGYDFYGPGDGACLHFAPRDMFRVGTELVTVDGDPQNVGTDYVRYNVYVIDGVSYAQAVVFGVAPTAGADVRISYAKVPGLRAMRRDIVVFDSAARVEVNSAGQLDPNGGWWPANAGTVLSGRTATSTSSSSISDSSLSMAIDQYAGFTVTITEDTGNPAALGQTRVIRNNTATGITTETAWSSNPSVGAKFAVTDCATGDGLHPSTLMHIEMARAIDPSLL